MTATYTDAERDAEAWGDLIDDLRHLDNRPRALRRVAIIAATFVALGLAAVAGYVAAPDREPAPAPVVVVCQEQDPALCAEMPGVR